MKLPVLALVLLATTAAAQLSQNGVRVNEGATVKGQCTVLTFDSSDFGVTRSGQTCTIDVDNPTCSDCVALGSETTGPYLESVSVGSNGMTASAACGNGSETAACVLDVFSQGAGFLEDGGASNLTCGSSAQGKAQVMDDGTMQICDGATTSVRRTVVMTDVAQTLTFKTIDGGDAAAGTTRPSGSNIVQKRTHNTDCQSLTDGKQGEECCNEDDHACYTCVPTSGDCSGSEWILTSPVLDPADFTCTATTCALGPTIVHDGDESTGDSDDFRNKAQGGVVLTGTSLFIPAATTLTSGDCDDAAEAGQLAADSDATTGTRLYLCEGAAGWVLVSSGLPGTTALSFAADSDNTGGSEPAFGAGYTIEGGSGDLSMLWLSTTNQFTITMPTATPQMQVNGNLHLNGPDGSTFFQMSDSTEVAAPGAGLVLLYASTDGEWYKKDSGDSTNERLLLTNANVTGDVACAAPSSGTSSCTLNDASVEMNDLNATGTPSSTTFLRGDGQWVTGTGDGGLPNPTVGVRSTACVTHNVQNTQKAIFGVAATTVGSRGATIMVTVNDRDTNATVENLSWRIYDNGSSACPTDCTVSTPSGSVIGNVWTTAMMANGNDTQKFVARDTSTTATTTNYCLTATNTSSTATHSLDTIVIEVQENGA